MSVSGQNDKGLSVSKCLTLLNMAGTAHLYQTRELSRYDLAKEKLPEGGSPIRTDDRGSGDHRSFQLPSILV
jgi:hypothetical protein